VRCGCSVHGVIVEVYLPVGACCLVHVVWRYPGNVYVADVYSVGCWPVWVSVFAAGLNFLYKGSLYVSLFDIMCGEVPQTLNVVVLS
jgi:hypothetical protein